MVPLFLVLLPLLEFVSAFPDLISQGFDIGLQLRDHGLDCQQVTRGGVAFIHAHCGGSLWRLLLRPLADLRAYIA